MKLIKSIVFSVLVLSIISCGSKKDTTKEVAATSIETQKESEITEKQMLEKGFKKGIIVFNKGKKSPCEYVIQIEDGTLLEGMKDFKSELKTDGMLVWVKYYAQRRMSYCGNTMPVEVVGMEKRIK